MSDRTDVIERLSSGLQSVGPGMRPAARALLWCLTSAAFVVGITHGLGPIRPDALTQLLTVPRFMAEMALGAGTIALVAVMAFRAAVPGALTRQFAQLGLTVLLLWLGYCAYSLLDPSLTPSRLGKRAHCFVETLAFGMPPAIAALLLTRRLYPLRPLYTALLSSTAAGLLPALYMQIACMYAPSHALLFHLAPGLLVAAAGTALAAVAAWQRPRRWS